MSSIKHKAITVAAAAGAIAAGLTGTALAAAHTSTASSNQYAKVDAAGSLVAGNGVTSTTALGSGRYEVTFGQDVSGCAYVATTGNAYSQAVQAYTAGGHASADGVYVETKNQGGGLTPAPFDLVVDCGATATPYAVIGYNADLVRSSNGVSLTSLGAGRYDVSFPSTVAHCAAIATVGDPGNGLVYNPSGVYTGAGPNNQTIYIETKNPGGGLQTGVPFHLALMCPGAANVHGAVVSADGITARSFNSTLSYRTDTGQFYLVTRAPVGNCATVATRGSANRAVPYTPSTMESVPGPAANTVGIQVRTLLQFGGTLDDQSFHAAVVC